MISQATLKLKSGSSLHQRKNKLNYRSLSLIDNKKINLSQNINSRLKTQSQQLKIQKSKKSQHKLSLLLNSFQQSKTKQVRTKRVESIQSPTQNLFNEDQITEQIKNEKKYQNEWVNSVLPTMTAQALHQQNQQLKKQCNFLKQQNSKLSSKLMFERKQKQKLAKQLSLQNEYYNLYQRIDLFDSKGFDNEKSNTKLKGKINNQFGFHPVNYMITGIKFRYEKLKNDYELKCKHVEEIMKLTNQTQIQEVIKENEILTQENRKLLSKIIELEQKNRNNQQQKGQIQWNLQNGFKSNKFQSLSKFSPRSLTTLIQAKNQLQTSNKKLDQQIATLEKIMQNLQEELHQKSSSIKSLHKTLTFLDNQLYYKKKQNSKLKKVQKQIEVKLLSLEKQNIDIKKKCKSEIQNVRKLNEQIFLKEKQIFLKEIQDKNQKITKLEKQISYLSTLLKYWKPLQKDQKSSIRPLSSSKIDYQQFDESGHLRTSLLLVSNRKRTKTKISQNDKSAQDLKLNLKQPVLSLKPSEFEGVEISSSDQQVQNSTLRIPKTSRKKHSEKGYKARKINPLQIEYMKQQLRYRCMAERLTIDQIRKYFNFHSQNCQNLRKSQIVWKQKYVTMKQLQSILIQAPFVLTKQQALKFSRFIVEDTSAQHVFCDENNQIQRDIVKSIIQAFLGDYQLPDIQKCKMQLQSILKNYGVNLRRALDALCQNQVVSPKKLFQLMQSLGIEVSLQLRNEIICRLYEKSGNRDINFLRYELIFQPGFI